ncbi:MAG: HDIG domain-containing protein [Myxococcales bacterium]|nr:HDIG domain-containing protein [Myxococcales bacterium]
MPAETPARSRLRGLGHGLLGLVALALLVASVGPTDTLPAPPPLGPASRELVALRDFEDAEPMPDLAARQARAAATVPVHYRFNAGEAATRIDGIRAAFRLVRPKHRLYLSQRDRLNKELARWRARIREAKVAVAVRGSAKKQGPNLDLVLEARDRVRASEIAVAALDKKHSADLRKLRGKFAEKLTPNRDAVTSEAFATLQKQGFSEEIELLLGDVVQVLLGQRIVRDKERLQDDLGRGVLDVQARRRYSQKEAQALAAVELDEARKLADRYVDEFVRRKKPSRFDDGELQDAAHKLARGMVTATFVRDAEATRKAEQAARSAVPKSRVVHFSLGQSLVKRGDMVTDATQRRVSVMLAGMEQTGTLRALAGTTLFVTILIALFAAFALRFLPQLRRRPKDAWLLSGILLVHTATLRLLIELGEMVVSPGGAVTTTMWVVMLPFALGPTLATLFLRAATGAPFALVTASMTGLLAYNAPLLRGQGQLLALLSLVALLLGLAGVYSTRRFRARADLARGALLVAVFGMAAAAVLALFTAPAATSLIDADNGLLLVMGAASGGLSYLLVAALTPLFESAFNRLTDIKLLELTSMNHPALRKLATETPGTFTHSVMVGNLAEAACDAIGANGLLARVGAYYHDVGKTRAAQYFAENQAGDNPHDRLKPRLSALIIRSHVKDGIEMLQGYGLPQEIIDFVPQHHGTSLVEHFYNRARREAEDTGEEILEEDFRYPGPKPQTKEAALMMIADMLEAATKALPDPTPDRIGVLVQRLIAKKVEDNQLDECDMTLRELAAVERAFTHTLVGMHHRRPVYLPPPKQKDRATLLRTARRMRSQRQTVRMAGDAGVHDTQSMDQPVPGNDGDAGANGDGEAVPPEAPTAVLSARRGSGGSKS